MISSYFDNANVSLYQPSDPKVQEITKYAKRAYARGHEIQTKSWTELNNRSLIEDEQNGKNNFNVFVEEGTDDPSEAWKWPGRRGEARKRGIALHAQITAGYLFAGISAQDENNKEDRAAGDFMRGIVEWMVENSDYGSSFIQASMGIMMNPITYLGAEFAEVMQSIRVKTDKGYELKEVLDEELSGFRAPVYSSSDIMITNAYISPFNFQRQTCVIKNRYLDYDDAKRKYGDNENWKFVQKGHNSVFNETDGMFYDVYDSDNQDVVKETICLWRGQDLEVSFLGGVYMGNENVEWNPMKHRDLKNQPKYNVVPFGYSLISEHFVFYKSLMSDLHWEDSFYDEFSRNVLNRELLDLNPPTVTSGDEDDLVRTAVIFPGSNVVAKSKDFNVKSILPPSQGNRYAALADVKNSIEEKSISDVASGQLPQATQKATSVNQAVQSGRILLKGLGRTLGQSIVAYTKLMVDISVNHLSTIQINEITGGVMEERYREFVLPNKVSQGKRVTQTFRFDKNLVGKEMTKKEKEMYAVALAEESGYPESQNTIISMNPEMAARMKYLISYDPEDMFVQNQQQMQIMLQNMYGQGIPNDPNVKRDVFMREYMYAFFRSKGDDFIQDNPEPTEVPTLGKMPTPMPQNMGV